MAKSGLGSDALEEGVLDHAGHLVKWRLQMRVSNDMGRIDTTGDRVRKPKESANEQDGRQRGGGVQNEKS